MIKKLLLLLGWAMIGQGMWYCKGNRPKLKKDFSLKDFTEPLREHKDLFVQTAQECLHEKLVKEYLELDDALRMIQPKDKITFHLNNGASLDCPWPHRVTHTHVTEVESISDVIVCNKESRVVMFPTSRDSIKITLTTCASEDMCNEYMMLRGSVKKFGQKLFIVAPQFDSRLTSCFIEHPWDSPITLAQIGFQEFMDQFDSSTNSTDSSDLDLSGDE